MSRIAQLALATAAMVAAGSALLPAASPAADLLIYQEQLSEPCAYQGFLAEVVNRLGYQARRIFHQRTRGQLCDPLRHRAPFAQADR